MSGLIEKTNEYLLYRRQRILDGSINSIPSPFIRFRRDFIGLEQDTYYVVTSFTKGGKSQFVSHLLFSALLYCYENEKKTGVSVKVLYFPLEEVPIRITLRFYSWLLMIKEGIRISPADLRSSDNNKPLDIKYLNLLEEKYGDLLTYFENHFIIYEDEGNPTGIYKTCKRYAEEHGKVTYKEIVVKNEFGVEEVRKVFDTYTANDPNEYVIPLIDTINLVDREKDLITKKQCIDKLSEYCAKYLRNRYHQSPIVIQQQNTNNENIESIKNNRVRPTTAGVMDSTNPPRDANITIGIFNPYKFEIPRDLDYYDITILKDHYRSIQILTNRDGELGGSIGMFFDGATTTWHELPKPGETSKMKEVYKYVQTLDS